MLVAGPKPAIAQYPTNAAEVSPSVMVKSHPSARTVVMSMRPLMGYGDVVLRLQYTSSWSTPDPTFEAAGDSLSIVHCVPRDVAVVTAPRLHSSTAVNVFAALCALLWDTSRPAFGENGRPLSVIEAPLLVAVRRSPTAYWPPFNAT